MKLKLIVVSMSVLGLISYPVFATTKHHKNKTHHHATAKHHTNSKHTAKLAKKNNPKTQQLAANDSTTEQIKTDTLGVTQTNTSDSTINSSATSTPESTQTNTATTTSDTTQTNTTTPSDSTPAASATTSTDTTQTSGTTTSTDTTVTNGTTTSTDTTLTNGTTTPDSSLTTSTVTDTSQTTTTDFTKATTHSSTQKKHVTHASHGPKYNTRVKHTYRHAYVMPTFHYRSQVPNCMVDNTTLTLRFATQNEGRALPNPCTTPVWFNYIQVTGGVNIDFGKFGPDGNFEGENYKHFSLNDAYINISADLNDWVRTFFSISYSDPTSTYTSHFIPDVTDPTWLMDRWNYAYSNVYKLKKLAMEQAYAIIGNPAYTPLFPIFLQVGRQFQEFGHYKIHPITVPFTQVMSEVLADSFKVGFLLPSGFRADISVFDDPIREVEERRKSHNYVISLGMTQRNVTWFNWDAGAAYIYNIIAAGDIKHAVELFTWENAYFSRVGGVALYGDFFYGPFYLNGRWVSTIQRFDNRDLPYNGLRDIDPFTGEIFSEARGAKPWALSIHGGYIFEHWCRIHTLYVGYETSREAAGLGLPGKRWLAGLDVEAYRNTHFALEWDHDKDYPYNQGGTKKDTNLVSLRVGVLFN